MSLPDKDILIAGVVAFAAEHPGLTFMVAFAITGALMGMGLVGTLDWWGNDPISPSVGREIR